ncbi:uncharacterized protein LOC131013242 [Salvia miltiorrhiza]|uniref:uncharacterized protein LOC131013242 n=1 Tax=Salvia miltiorrhiza TaxID=226208 RepID=UPI0025ABB7D6|nr:uncharacterized protein LOC131013242 [Salvia miltiorrhiza]
MVRDIMAIPISSVASESAFSTGSRVLSKLRSSLTVNMLEALICAEDWLKSSSSDKFLQDEEDVSETELEKEFESVLTQLGMSGGHGVRGESSGDVPSQTSRSVLP